MKLSEYQAATARTDNRDILPEHQMNMHVLGLVGEVGELVEAHKKHLYHGHSFDFAALRKEMGDILWYLARLADDHGFNLDDVAEENLAKLKARYPDGFSHEASRNRSI